MDALIEMTEKAAWGIVGLVGCIVLFFVAGSIASVCGDAVDRWRGSRPPDEEKNGEATSSGRSGSFGVLFLIVMGIFLIAFLAFLGENDQIADLARGAAAFAVLIAVCWCCDKVIARRRKWRESGRQGHWWTQKGGCSGACDVRGSGEGPHPARGDQLRTASEETRVRKLIWKFVPPREVRLTIKAARKFLDNNSWTSTGILNSEVSSLAKEDAERTIHVVRTGAMSPDHVALALVTIAINRHLGSGMHHIYRGALNMVGMDMLKVWRSAKKEIVERGYASEKDMETANSILMEDIKNVG